MLVFQFHFAIGATVRNVSCNGNITTLLQAAIDSSADGDTVNIGAGSCTGATVNWENKNIEVHGQGMTQTTVSGLSFEVKNSEKSSFRISGLAVGAPSTWKINADNRTTGIKGWRIDNIKWSYPTCTQNIAVSIQGITWGVIDHNNFSNAGNAIFIVAYAENTVEVNPFPSTGMPGMGGYSWSLPLNLGSDEAVYIEDNNFSMDNGCYYGVGDSFYGGRSVFRHNSVTNAYWQNHAARSAERGGNLKAEIYGNDFNATDAAWSRAIHVRSGTGVIFNNSLRGFFNTIEGDNQRSNGQNTGTPFGSCDGSSKWDGNKENGWPCLDQVGRGPGGQYFNLPFNTSQPSVPLQSWNNGSVIGCSNGGTCDNKYSIISDGDSHVSTKAHNNGEVDILNTPEPKVGYTPFVYPHPLVSGQVALQPSLVAPKNFRWIK